MPRSTRADRLTFPSVFSMLGAIAQRPGNTVTAAQARRWSSSWLGAGLALIVLSLAVYLPGLWSIPPVDRDESRFAQASRTMLESGDFIVPRVQDKPRLNKPPLIYWLQCGSAKFFGDEPGRDGLGEWGNGNIWAYRLPSVLAAIGSVLLTWRLGLRLFDPRAATLAAALLAVCPMIVWDAHQARADQLMVFTVLGTMFALHACWMGTAGSASSHLMPPAARPPVLWVLTFWFFIGSGILAKGPITPLIALLAIITLGIISRSARWVWRLQPVLGLIIVAAIVGPWVYAVVHRVGWETYWSIIRDETLGRSIEGKEGHWGPPGYHTALLAVLFWPGSLLTLAAVIRAVKRGWRGREFRIANRSEAFLLAWAIPTWIVFECVMTKLPHYTMPLYPAIALLTARAALSVGSRYSTLLRSTPDRLGLLLWAGIGIVALVGSLGAVMEWGAYPTAAPARTPIVIAALLILALILSAAVVLWRSRAIMRAHVLGILSMVVWCWIGLGWLLPRGDDLWISRSILQHVPAGPIALVGYHEDSAIFLSRGRAHRIESLEIRSWIESHPDGSVVVDTLREPAAVRQLPPSYVTSRIINGYNYSTGKQARVEIYVARASGVTP